MTPMAAESDRWRAVGALLGIAVLALAPCAAGLGVEAGSVTVYSPEEVGTFYETEAGLSILRFPGCRQWTLADDDGLYCPMPLAEVLEAVGQIQFQLAGLDVEIVILPVPRREVAVSSAEGRVIFLSPARSGYPVEHVHYTVAHEIGHVVHHLLLPNPEDPLWERYAALRGIDLEAARQARDHASRLNEIFAEDFRVLFGGPLARCGSGVENHDLVSPETVPGLAEFFLSLPGAWQGRLRLYAAPNPFCESVRLEAFALDAHPGIDQVAVYDVEGRLVASIPPAAGGAVMTWNGRRDDGSPVAPGVYYAVIRCGSDVRTVPLVRAAP
jgi:hypothetical protein